MKLIYLKFALLTIFPLTLTSNALAVYRCTIDGKTVFQDSACPGSLGTISEDTQKRARQREIEKDNFLKHSLANNAMTSEERSQRPIALETQAKAAITERMIDPKSTDFRNIKVGMGIASRTLYATENVSGPPIIDVVCGEVNSKNRMGGYVGFKPFRWASDGRIALPDSDKFESVLNNLIVSSCARIHK